MNPKYLFYSILVLFFAGSLIGVYLIRPKTTTPTPVSTHITTTLPVKTTIIREQIPGRIDTVYVDNVPQEVARYQETIAKDKVVVDLDIAFNKATDMFSVNSNITSFRDSVYVERIIQPKVSLFRPMVAFGAGFTGEDGLNPECIMAETGIVIRGKYALSAFGTTNKTFGLKVGVNF